MCLLYLTGTDCMERVKNFLFAPEFPGINIILRITTFWILKIFIKMPSSGLNYEYTLFRYLWKDNCYIAIALKQIYLAKFKPLVTTA